jgi:hypothetical protein
LTLDYLSAHLDDLIGRVTLVDLSANKCVYASLQPFLDVGKFRVVVMGHENPFLASLTLMIIVPCGRNENLASTPCTNVLPKQSEATSDENDREYVQQKWDHNYSPPARHREVGTRGEARPRGRLRAPYWN